jgi:hypothetical protein
VNFDAVHLPAGGPLLRRHIGPRETAGAWSDGVAVSSHAERSTTTSLTCITGCRSV